MIILFFLPFFMLTACEPNPPIVESPVAIVPDTGLLALKWEQPQPGSSIGVPVFNNEVVVFPNVFGSTDKLLTCFDKSDGELLWHYGNAILDNDDFGADPTVSLMNGIIAACGEDQVVTIDVKQGVTNWETNLGTFGAGGVRMAVIGEYIYHAHHHNYPHTEAHLVRSHYQYGGTWDTLFSFQMVDNYELRMDAPSLHIKPNGDSLLIFRLGQFNFTLSDGRQDLIAFNLATRAIEWRKDDFEPSGNCNVRPPTVYDSKVYVMGTYALYCFDANTGQLLWEKAEPGGLLGKVSLTIAEGKVFVKPSNSHFIAYDAQTGNLAWDVTSSTVSPNGSVYYKGHLFITGADIGIYVHRVTDGKLVYLKQMPGRNDLYHPIAIDPDEGLLFTSDGKNVLCFKIDL